MESSCTLILSLDIGASLSKGLVTISTAEKTITGIVEMESNVFEIDRQILRNQEYFKNTIPENRAWIAKGARRTGNAVAIGTLAKKFNDIKDGQIEGVKYEYAIEKILASIGVVLERYSLRREGLECYINLLIPSDEKKGQDLIEKNLKREIKKFQFGDKLVRAKLVQLNCFAEGTGGLLFRIGQQAELESSICINDIKIAILMLGHRNCSFLTIKNGGYEKRETVRIGYFDILSDIKRANIGQKMNDLEQIIPQIKEDNQERYFKALIRGERAKNQQEEILKLKKSYNEAHQIYWQKLERWIEAHMPTYVDEILIFGGAAQIFRPKLKEYLSWADLYWGDPAVTQIADLFPEKFATDRSLAYRFIDVYGIHKDACTF